MALSKKEVPRWLQRNLLWSQGKEILVVCGIVGAIACICSSTLLGTVAAATFLFSLYFFRNPTRTAPETLSNERLLVAPADGKVVEVVDVEDGFVGAATRVSIFLSPLDVHVQWVPIAGTIQQMVYRPGKFVVAFAPKSSDVNERNDLCMLTRYKEQKVVVRQIAGFVARRICWWVEPTSVVETGDKYGMIRFGSRVDLLVPRGAVEIKVKVDDRVYGGQSIVGEFYETNEVAVERGDAERPVS